MQGIAGRKLSVQRQKSRPRRTALDVMRVDTDDGAHRFAACVGSYGYMGDLMALSERLRWLGPARYGLAGALTLLRGRAYGAAVSLLPAEPARCVGWF